MQTHGRPQHLHIWMQEGQVVRLWSVGRFIRRLLQPDTPTATEQNTAGLSRVQLSAALLFVLPEAAGAACSVQGAGSTSMEQRCGSRACQVRRLPCSAGPGSDSCPALHSQGRVGALCAGQG